MIAGLRTSLAARIVATLVGFTFLAVATLLGGIYLFGVKLPVDKIQSRVETEAAQLARIEATGGEAALRSALERRRQAPSAEKAFDLLLNKNGRRITGNMPSWPAIRRSDWVRIEADLYRDGDEDDHDSLSRDLILPDGRRLIVGRDVEVFADRQELMIEAALWSALAVLVFGLTGGLVASRIIARRLERVAETAHAVMAGDLTVRVPIKGSGDDFDQLGITLNSMLDRNQELVMSLGRVSDNIAHELRTPLARLQTTLEQLAEADGKEQRAILMDAGLAEAGRLGRIFDALLRIARLQTGRHRLQREDVALDRILTDALEYYEPEIEEKRQQLTVRVAPCTIQGDRDLIFQAVANLVDNAVKFTPCGGTIEAGLEGRPGEAILKIRDSGPGVPQETWPRLTERFFRSAEAGAVPGTGLGLTLVQAIAEAHGAELEFSGGAGAFETALRFPRNS